MMVATKKNTIDIYFYRLSWYQFPYSALKQMEMPCFQLFISEQKREKNCVTKNIPKGNKIIASVYCVRCVYDFFNMLKVFSVNNRMCAFMCIKLETYIIMLVLHAIH